MTIKVMNESELTSTQRDRALRLRMDMQTGDNANGFLSAVLLAMQIRFSKDIPTAAVDKTTFYINPDFLFDDNWSPENRLFVAFHEALHVVYRHVVDRGDRDAVIWNYAGDYRINTDLLEMGFNRPPHGIFDDEGIYKEMTTDQIYEDLVEKQKNGEFSPDVDADQDWIGDIKEGSGGGDDGDGTEPVNQPSIEEIIRTATAMAEMTDGWGNLPGSLKAQLTAEKSTKINWRDELAAIATTTAKSAYNYKKFARRGMCRGVYNPLRESKRLKAVHTFWDTSISVTDEQISLMKGEVMHLLDTMKPEKIFIHCFDTAISSSVETETSEDISELEITGRGGTSLSCIEEYMRTQTEEAGAILIFSDLYCQQLTDELPLPTFWIALDNPGASVNFGTLIHFDSTQ